jgi:tetratricopeptide (TPR) repeat protein
MSRPVFSLICLLVLSFPLAAVAQEGAKPPKRMPPPNQAPPRSDQPSPDAPQKDTQQPSRGGSSSKDLPVDLSPPADDDKNHPESSTAVHEAEDAAGLYEGDEIGGVQEFRPWNPHKAEKDVEVGDFYFKRKNYRAALDRYREALYYKYNDAVATFRLGVCQEKLGDAGEARKAYEAYLKILPEGPFAGEAHQALDRLKAQSPPEKAAPEGDRAQH